jgi:type II secretion system protein H
MVNQGPKMISTTGQASSGHPINRGFTLIELILVLLVIGMVIAMVVPSLRDFAAGRQVSDAAENLLSLTRWAQSQATTLGRPCRLNIDPEAGTYWLTVQEQGAYKPLRADLGQTFRLPEGVTFTLQFDQEQNQDRRPGFGAVTGSPARKPTIQRNYIQFYPSGRCDTATIEVRGKKGAVFQVSCPSATESFVMSSPSEER